MTLGEVQRDGVMKLKGFKSNELIMLKPHSEREGGMVFLCSHVERKKLLLQKSGMRAAGTKKWRTQKKHKGTSISRVIFQNFSSRSYTGARCAFLILLLRIRIM